MPFPETRSIPAQGVHKTDWRRMFARQSHPYSWLIGIRTVAPIIVARAMRKLPCHQSAFSVVRGDSMPFTGECWAE